MTAMLRPLPLELRSRLRSGVAITSIAQCVEELVLNSLDAGATCVAVRLDIPGSKIQVVDNGCGLGHDQLNFVAERYSTSKCHSLTDLDEKLQHFGYRGEALASIRDISAILEIESRSNYSTQTFKRLFQNGKPLPLSESKTHRPSAGTTVTVQDLFHSLPVRQKCLNEALELERVRQRLEAVALIHPMISFSFRNEATCTKVLQTHKSNSILGAFTYLFGVAKGRPLRKVARTVEKFNIHGYISKESHHNKSLQFVYINDRLVLKTKLHKSINYVLSKSTIVKRRVNMNATDTTPKLETISSSPQRQGDRFGVFVLNISCPLSEYDVTFDPAKTLVEFKDWDCICKMFEDMTLDFLIRENLLKIEEKSIGKPSPELQATTSPRDIESQSKQDFRKEPQESDQSDTDSENPLGPANPQSYGKGISTANTSNTLCSETVQRTKPLNVDAIVEGIITRKTQEERDKDHEDKISSDFDVTPGGLLSKAAQISEGHEKRITCTSLRVGEQNSSAAASFSPPVTNPSLAHFYRTTPEPSSSSDGTPDFQLDLHASAICPDGGRQNDKPAPSQSTSLHERVRVTVQTIQKPLDPPSDPANSHVNAVCGDDTHPEASGHPKISLSGAPFGRSGGSIRTFQEHLKRVQLCKNSGQDLNKEKKSSQSFPNSGVKIPGITPMLKIRERLHKKRNIENTQSLKHPPENSKIQNTISLKKIRKSSLEAKGHESLESESRQTDFQAKGHEPLQSGSRQTDFISKGHEPLQSGSRQMDFLAKGHEPLQSGSRQTDFRAKGHEPLQSGSKQTHFIAKGHEPLQSGSRQEDFLAKGHKPLPSGSRQTDFISKGHEPLQSRSRQTDFLAKGCEPLQSGSRQTDFIAAGHEPLQSGSRETDFMSSFMKIRCSLKSGRADSQGSDTQLNIQLAPNQQTETVTQSSVEKNELSILSLNEPDTASVHKSDLRLSLKVVADPNNECNKSENDSATLTGDTVTNMITKPMLSQNKMCATDTRVGTSEASGKTTGHKETVSQTFRQRAVTEADHLHISKLPGMEQISRKRSASCNDSRRLPLASKLSRLSRGMKTTSVHGGLMQSTESTSKDHGDFLHEVSVTHKFLGDTENILTGKFAGGGQRLEKYGDKRPSKNSQFDVDVGETPQNPDCGKYNRTDLKNTMPSLSIYARGQTDGVCTRTEIIEAQDIETSGSISRNQSLSETKWRPTNIDQYGRVPKVSAHSSESSDIVWDTKDLSPEGESLEDFKKGLFQEPFLLNPVATEGKQREHIQAEPKIQSLRGRVHHDFNILSFPFESGHPELIDRTHVSKGREDLEAKTEVCTDHEGLGKDYLDSDSGEKIDLLDGEKTLKHQDKKKEDPVENLGISVDRNQCSRENVDICEENPTSGIQNFNHEIPCQPFDDQDKDKGCSHLSVPFSEGELKHKTILLTAKGELQYQEVSLKCDASNENLPCTDNIHVESETPCFQPQKKSGAQKSGNLTEPDRKLVNSQFLTAVLGGNESLAQPSTSGKHQKTNTVDYSEYSVEFIPLKTVGVSDMELSSQESGSESRVTELKPHFVMGHSQGMAAAHLPESQGFGTCVQEFELGPEVSPSLEPTIEDVPSEEKRASEPTVKNTCPVQSPQAQKETLRISSTGSSSPEKTIFVGQSWTCKVDPGTGRKVFINRITGSSSFQPPGSSEFHTIGSASGGQSSSRAAIHIKNPLLPSGTTPPMSVDYETLLPRPRAERDSSRVYQRSSDAILPLDGSTGLSDMLTEHIETQDTEAAEELSVKWREGSLPKDTAASTTVSKLFDEWENPAFKIPEQPAQNVETSSAPRGATRVQRAFHPHKFTRDMLNTVKVLGQVDMKFIACLLSKDPGPAVGPPTMLVVVDQHAAHERVCLERLTREAFEEDGTCMRQSQVTPAIEVRLTEEEVRVMTAYRSGLEKIGVEFTLDVSRRDTLYIHAVPACLVEREANELRRGRAPVAMEIIESLIKEYIELLQNTHGAAGTLPRAVCRVLNSQACHGAIKFGDPLTIGECEKLIEELAGCQLPFQCAHGRPSIMPVLDLDLVHRKYPTERWQPKLWKLTRMMESDVPKD